MTFILNRDSPYIHLIYLYVHRVAIYAASRRPEPPYGKRHGRYSGRRYVSYCLCHFHVAPSNVAPN